MHRLGNVIQRQKLVTASPEMTVLETVTLMTEREVGAIPILDQGRLVGVFSERDLMTRVVVSGRDPRTTLVGEVMTREVVTATLEDHVDHCLDKMRRAGCRHLPIEVNGRVISMIAMRHLLRNELEEQTDEVRHLRAYLHQSPI